jgi:hypothetical protein
LRLGTVLQRIPYLATPKLVHQEHVVRHVETVKLVSQKGCYYLDHMFRGLRD